MLVLALAAGTFAVLLAPGIAEAQSKLEARYTAYLAGLPIGNGTWLIDINDNTFSAAASGQTSGLLRTFTGGQGTTATRGTFNGVKAVASSYSANIITRKKNDDIHITIAAGNVKEVKVEPPTEDDDERVPVTEAHRQNVQDPMSATLVRVMGNGDLLSADACRRSVSVYDGRMRYDLQLDYKRMDKVSADKGYAGPVVVCSVRFTPVAGYIPSRTAIKYVASRSEVEVWLAPIAGTRVLVPFRVQGPTPIGQAVLEADEFVATAAPTKASANIPPRSQ